MPRPPPDPLYTLKEDLNPVHCVCFWSKAQNEKLFAGCQSGQVQLWSLQSNRSVEGLQAHSGPCIKITCSGDNIITQGKGDGLVKSWHTLEGGGWAPNYTIHTRHTIFCGFSSLCKDNGSSSMLVCPEDNHSVAVYSTYTGERLANINMNDFNLHSKQLGYIMALKAFFEPSTMRPMLLTSHECGLISLRDLFALGNEICSINVGEPPLCLEFDPIAGIGTYGTPENLRIQKFGMDFKTGTAKLGGSTCISNPGISCIRLRPDSKIMATGGWDARLRIFSWHHSRTKTARPEKSSSEHLVKSESNPKEEINGGLDKPEVNKANDSVDNADDCSQCKAEDSSSSLNSDALVEKLSSLDKPMKPLAVLKHHTKSIMDIAFSEGPVESWECSCLMAAASNDGGISLWDIYT